MPKIISVVTSLPPHQVSQKQARELACKIFSKGSLNLERLLPVFDHAGIDFRYFSCPIDWFGVDHSPEEKHKIYIESATRLSAEASTEALKQAGLSAADIDYIIYVNTTGLATPSIDSRLINILGLRDTIHRTPIWGLGCAGGAAGMSHAYHYLLGHPGSKVLLVAAELCGLTFIADDYSKSNLVATALFGDGAAAVILAGDGCHEKGTEILATHSRFYPDSLDVMGWNVVSKGLQVVFTRRIPEIVRQHARADLAQFLEGHDLTLDDIGHYIVHPGGVKVIEAYEHALNLSNGQFDLARGILRDYGNMSSVTVLFVLQRFLQNRANGGAGCGNEWALMSALGPGFSSESLLLRV